MSHTLYTSPHASCVLDATYASYTSYLIMTHRLLRSFVFRTMETDDDVFIERVYSKNIFLMCSDAWLVMQGCVVNIRNLF